MRRQQLLTKIDRLRSCGSSFLRIGHLRSPPSKWPKLLPRIRPRLSGWGRIQFTAPDKSLGVASRDLAIVESIAPIGRITARLDNQVKLNSKLESIVIPTTDTPSLVMSSHGLTADRVLVHADTSVHPDLVKSRFAYVSTSRDGQDATPFEPSAPSWGAIAQLSTARTTADKYQEHVQKVN